MPPALASLLQDVRRRDAGQPEFLQAVTEVLESLARALEAGHRELSPLLEDAVLARLVEAERILQFRVAWTDDRGATRVNRAWRVQHSSAVGPYKGGMRFHPSVNLSILKFLAFEQTLKNALTTLPLGGGKGGADFDPKGRSDAEVMRFCQALMTELSRHLGPDTDVPAGDIGVGEREIGYMVGMMKKLTVSAAGSFTGKGLAYGGSPRRRESTGYGLVLFAGEMLATRRQALEGLRVAVSGSGNVARHAIEKAMAMGARVVTVSDSGGVAVDEKGFTPEKLALLDEVKRDRAGRVETYAQRLGLPFVAGVSPWHVPVDVALPCATQNELALEDAKTLLAHGVRCVAEGANMPCTLEAAEFLRRSPVLYAPGKASNAGGVIVSELEMAQNAMHVVWTGEEVDRRLAEILRTVHENCMRYGRRPDGSVDYVDGANLAALARLGEAIRAQGVV